MSHGHEHKHHFPLLRLGPTADRCEVISDARIVHPHGSGRGHAGHSHGHVAAREHDRRRLAFTLGLTGIILVAEVVGGLVSGSLALLSDAGHMLTDLSAQALSLLALLFAARPANARRTYGYYRLEILAALANGVILAVLAAYILWEAWKRLSAPPEVHTSIMIGVASVGLVANVVSAWLLSRAESLNVRAAYSHIVSDALASVAVLGGGITMAVFSGVNIIDPILGFVIGSVVVFSAYRLIREAVDVLLEAVPADIDLERVREEMRAIDGVHDVHDLHIWTITSGLHALSAHLVVQKETLGPGCDDLLTRVKQMLLRQHRIAHSTLQIESTEYTHVSHVH